MKKNSQQEAAMRLTTEYTRFLTRQERVMERMLERKITQMEPLIEEMITHRNTLNK